MKLKCLIILITLSLASIQSYVIVSDVDNANYELAEKIVQEEVDEYGNVVFRTVYKVKDPLKRLSGQFETFRNKFVEDQKIIFDQVRDAIEEYKTFRDYEVNLYTDEIAEINEKFNDNFNILEAQKLEAEKDISDIKEKESTENAGVLGQMRLTEEEYKNQMEKLKQRKYLLTALMTQHCDDCDEVLREYKLDIEIAKVDKDIADLEEKFLKQANENGESLKELDAEKAVELNAKYSELIGIYQKQIAELKKKDEINAKYQNIIGEWKLYAESIENVYIKVRSKMEGVTSDSLDLTKIASIEDTSENYQIEIINTEIENDDDDTKNGISIDNLVMEKVEASQNNTIDDFDRTELRQPSNFKPSFEWVQFQEYSNYLPKNAVLGGVDVDGAPLYIVRVVRRNANYYGKFAFSNERKNAYVTTPDREMGVTHFELLTAKNYGWCDTDAFENHSALLPICRVRYQESLIPGTLLEDGSCRIGFSYSAKIFTTNYEVISGGPCNY